ncbi:MAG TPA: hypothetical protein VKG25_27090, partial [Bryobacteraceae bacterium]|nr:hypothetical protein [Bryobacteraceae bacterium]
IATRRGIMCAHLEPAYVANYNQDSAARWEALPESELAQQRSIVLPLFHSMTVQMQDRVIEGLLSLARKP